MIDGTSKTRGNQKKKQPDLYDKFIDEEIDTFDYIQIMEQMNKKGHNKGAKGNHYLTSHNNRRISNFFKNQQGKENEDEDTQQKDKKKASGLNKTMIVSIQDFLNELDTEETNEIKNSHSNSKKPKQAKNQ